MSRARLFLLDGMALAYRAYYAFFKSNLHNSEGIPTGAIMGFANTISKLLEKEKPSHIAVAWDLPKPTFRHIKDETYKANRPPQPDDLRRSLPLIKDMMDYWGIPNIAKEGFEADDLIGTIAYQAAGQDVDVYMVTPDKDYMQLVTEHVFMYKPLNQADGFQIIDNEGVKEYFGVYPDKVIDVLAILGDKSDNIPGVSGIGKKGAPNLINKYGSLEAALDAAPKIKAKRMREGLINDREQALAAKEMVTIITDVPDTPKWDVLKWEQPDDKKLGLFFKRMEFRTLSKKYLGEEVTIERAVDKKDDSAQGDLFGQPTEASIPENIEFGYSSFDPEKVSYTCVKEASTLKKIVDELSKADAFCFDTETQGADSLIADIVGISLCAKAGEAYYVPLYEGQGVELEEAIELLKPLFANPKSTKIAHNLKFDLQVLERYGIEIAPTHFDTLIAAYLVNPDQKLKMDELAALHFNYIPLPIDSLFTTEFFSEEDLKKMKKTKVLDMAGAPVDRVTDYACEDADVTFRLYKVLAPKLDSDELSSISSDIEQPLVKVLSDMEKEGIRLDTEMLEEFSKILEHDLDTLEQKIYNQAGEEFNLNSPKQLGPILFDKLGLVPTGKLKKTKTGQYSTNESVLQDLAVRYEIAADIMSYRMLKKLKSTYVDALPKLVYEFDGKIHTSFNQAVANTGRLSSSNPNLQNIPIRTERGREMRKAFIASEGHVLLAADYSQVELRIIAAMAEDEAMINAFKEGEDIHSRTAKEIFGLDTLDEVTADHRRKAKEVNFGIPYGVSAFGLSQRIGNSRKEAKEMIDNYFDRFPKVKEFMNTQVEKAQEDGYVTTLFGRRRFLPDINSKNFTVKGFAERNAINMPIQGTAADIIKKAMIRIHNALIEKQLKTKMLLQVHDELVFEVPENELDEAKELILRLMEDFDIGVPLKVEYGTGKNWLEAH